MTAPVPVGKGSAVFTAEAAEIANMSVESFRSAMAYARNKHGVDHRLPGPDSRTPMWDAKGLRQYLDSRPGRGRWGSRPRAASSAKKPGSDAE